MKNKKIIIPIIFAGILFTSTSFGQLTPQQAVAEMGKGINIGNTLECPTEGSWGNGPVQEFFFDNYKDAGFSTVRIPIRWDQHLDTLPPYNIDSAWFARVEEIVDWGLSRDLFIIINSHHDDWIKTGYDEEDNRARFDSIWSQVSKRFADKPEKLIFEMINEPNGISQENVDELNARVLAIIRKTNPTRIVMFSGYMWANADQLIAAAIPDDDYLIGYYHSYDPYLFGLEAQGTWGTTTDRNNMKSKMDAVKTWSDANNIPVIVSEFGAKNTGDFNSRMLYYATYVEELHAHGFAFAVWDDGGWFEIYGRSQGSWNELKDIVINYPCNAPHIPSIEQDYISDVKLTWTNKTDAADSIIIERGTSQSNLSTLVMLPPNSTEFTDTITEMKKTYYYRLATHYNDSVTIYTYPLKIYVEEVIVFDVHNNPSTNDLVKLFPNPANDQITLKSSISDPLGNISIYDNSGKLVKNFYSDKAETVVYLNNITAGNYIVQLNLSGKEVNMTFIKH